MIFQIERQKKRGGYYIEEEARREINFTY